MTETTVEEVNQIVAAVAAKKQAWAELPPSQKLQILEEIRTNLDAEVDNWASAAARGHGYNPEDPHHGHLVSEVYLKGPGEFGSWLNAVIATYTSLTSSGKPPAPASVRRTPSGASAVTVFPIGAKEMVFAGGMRAEVFIEQGNVEQYSLSEFPAGLVGILAPGNFDAPVDVLHCMFLRNQVAVLKTNPVNHHSSTVLARILAPLVSGGYLAFIHGGIAPGQALTAHAAVDRLLLTGSCRSYDAIMWGATEEEQKANKASGKRKIDKEFDAELGSVNPYIICPGNWTAKQLEAHAQQLVSLKMFNDGHICASPQVVITCKNWPQRTAFLNRVRELLAQHPATRPYYPHCEKSYAAHLAQSAPANVCSNPTLFEGQLHPLFTTDLPKDHYVTQHEAFSPVLGEVPIDTPPTADLFLPTAVEYANTSCWGSLTATVIVDPATLKAQRTVVETAVDNLKFGAVSVNYGAMYNVLFGQLPWGAYPRHKAEDIQSGTGKIGNAYLFKNVTKSVTWGLFTHPAQPTLPMDPVARLKRDQIFARYAIYPTTLRLLRLLTVVLTGL